MNEELENRLKKIQIEDFIWIVYLIIIGISFYANSVERDYFLNNNKQSKEKYRELEIIVFTLVVLICIYFAVDNYKDLVKLNESANSDAIIYSYLTFVGSLAALLAGVIFLYVAIKDTEINIELAFN